MPTIQKLEELEQAVRGGPRMTLTVAAGDDPATVHAIARGVIDVLMKGLVSTDTFMKAVLDKENGLLPKGELLSHLAVMEIPSYPKLLLISDDAIIPNPTMDEKVQILNYVINIANSLGIETPKASFVSAAEKINFKLQSSVDAAVIKAMAERNQIKGVIVDGPLALDVSLSKKHCEIKGLKSPINGEADILIFPNIETANTFYKSVTLLSHGKSASVTMSTSAPIVLSSRADDDDTKFYSIVLAARMASHKIS
jgi:phosphate butyryltransferase